MPPSKCGFKAGVKEHLEALQDMLHEERLFERHRAGLRACVLGALWRRCAHGAALHALKGGMVHTNEDLPTCRQYGATQVQFREVLQRLHTQTM